MAIKLYTTFDRRAWTDHDGVKHPLPSYYISAHGPNWRDHIYWYESARALDNRIENFLNNGAEVVATNWLPDSRFCSPKDEYPKRLTL